MLALLVLLLGLLRSFCAILAGDVMLHGRRWQTSRHQRWVGGSVVAAELPRTLGRVADEVVVRRVGRPRSEHEEK